METEKCTCGKCNWWECLSYVSDMMYDEGICRNEESMWCGMEMHISSVHSDCFAEIEEAQVTAY